LKLLKIFPKNFINLILGRSVLNIADSFYMVAVTIALVEVYNIEASTLTSFALIGMIPSLVAFSYSYFFNKIKNTKFWILCFQIMHIILVSLLIFALVNKAHIAFIFIYNFLFNLVNCVLTSLNVKVTPEVLDNDNNLIKQIHFANNAFCVGPPCVLGKIELVIFSSNIVVNKDASLLYVNSLNNFITRFDLSNLKPDEEINVPQRATYLDTKRIQHNESIETFALSPDENTLAVVLKNMTVGAFSGIKNMTTNYSSEFILNEKSTHKASIDIIKFTPDSKKIITSADDYTIRVMDTESTMGKSQLLNGKIVASSRDKNSILILSGEKISKYQLLL